MVSLKSYLRDKQLLIVIDNMEHLVAAAPALSELLMSAPRLKMLVTSRSTLQIYGEQQFVVPPLQMPEGDDAHRPLTWSVTRPYVCSWNVLGWSSPLSV